MSRLKWDEDTKRYYETGVDRVVLYVSNSAEAWSGITAINESPSGAEPSKIYADNIVYGVVMSPEEDALTIEAFAYPEVFNKCVGYEEIGRGAYLGQQAHIPFGICWRSNIGSDKDPNRGYKLHMAPILYASPSEDSNSTINDGPEQKTFSWSATAIPVKIDEELSTSMIVLDSRYFKKSGLMNALKSIEDILYGTEKTRPRMIQPGEILSISTRSRMLLDNNGNSILDSNDEMITTAVYKMA